MANGGTLVGLLVAMALVLLDMEEVITTGRHDG